MVLGRLFTIFIAARGGLQPFETAIELPDVDSTTSESNISTSKDVESTNHDDQSETSLYSIQELGETKRIIMVSIVLQFSTEFF